MDILICKINYPNDPTNKLIPHQHFVGHFIDDCIELYSISSIVGKEYKVYLKDGNQNPDYYIIQQEEMESCNLRVPSFIDCTKSYRLVISGDMDIYKLSNRRVPTYIRDNIIKKINYIKTIGNHNQYSLNTEEFKNYNIRVKI